MALKSDTFKLTKTDAKTVGTKKVDLENRHKCEMEKVVSDARALAEDRRKALSSISSAALRVSANR
jgi:hypothetical protein